MSGRPFRQRIPIGSLCMSYEGTEANSSAAYGTLLSLGRHKQAHACGAAISAYFSAQTQRNLLRELASNDADK